MFDQPVKNKQGTIIGKLIEKSRSYDYITRKLLDFSYHQNYGFLKENKYEYSSTN